MHHLLIIRGLPGSGKSTLAKTLGRFHVEADMFFVKNGIYQFDKTKIREAHEWCFNTVCDALRFKDVVVSNTFTRIWEMQKYLDLPNPKTVITVEGNYGNVHGVPPSVVEEMRKRWEPYANR